MTAPRPMLCVLVDAFRHDYLDGARTPFLARVASEGRSAPLPTILGYSDAVRATIFTGAYPDEHGYWMEYRFAEGADPFRPFSRMSALDAFPSDVVTRGTKYVMSVTAMRALARRRGYPSLDLRHIPFGALRFFDITLRTPMTAPHALSMPTIFDRLSGAGLGWEYLSSVRSSDAATLDRVARLPRDTALVFVYLHHLDMVSHLHGISGWRFARVLGETDRRIERLAAAVRERLGDPDVLVFSDHGMSPTRRYVSLPGLRRHAAFGSGFCHALDATTVRLRYLRRDPPLEDELRSYVAGRLPGRWLSEDDRRAFRLPQDMRPWGDDVFLTEPGVVIFPNFHSYLRPKAMHAYDPADRDQDGIVVTSAGIDLPSAPRLVDLSGAIERATALAARSEEPV
jgi:predicted AlkP superfamily pyrophosphatase or phosphodiesterase